MVENSHDIYQLADGNDEILAWEPTIAAIKARLRKCKGYRIYKLTWPTGQTCKGTKTQILWLLTIVERVGRYRPIVKECEDCKQIWFPMKVRFVIDLFWWWAMVYRGRGHKVIEHYDEMMLEVR